MRASKPGSFGATVATLRNSLALYCRDLDLDGHLRELVEAELLPADCSAPLSPKQVALALIALSTDVHPIDAPEAASRAADFELRFRTHRDADGGWQTRPIELPTSAPVTFLDFLEQQIEAARGALPKAPSFSFLGGADEVLVDIAPSTGDRSSLVFLAPELEQRPYAGMGRAIAGPVIDVVAGLFEPVQQQKLDAELIKRLATALDLEWLTETRH
jgi:hypothetical protein